MCHSKNPPAMRGISLDKRNYRHQMIYKNIKADAGQILGSLSFRKGIESVLPLNVVKLFYVHFLQKGVTFCNSENLTWNLLLDDKTEL